MRQYFMYWSSRAISHQFDCHFLQKAILCKWRRRKTNFETFLGFQYPQKLRFIDTGQASKGSCPIAWDVAWLNQIIAHIWATSHTNEQNFAQIVTFCVIEPYFSLVVHLFVCIQGYLRSCVYVYIHVTCWPLEHTAFSKSKQDQMLSIFILTAYFPNIPQPEI